MGIGDSLRKAADNAMKDLGSTSEPAADGHVPDPDVLRADPSEGDRDPSTGMGPG